MLFKTYLDETGTDGNSQFAVVAGGVSDAASWVKAEKRWNALMKRREVRYFHAQEYNSGDGDFANWGVLKRKTFETSLAKLVRQNVDFAVSVAVDRQAHQKVKQEMRGIKNAPKDSDVGLGFRILRFYICDLIAKSQPGSEIHFVVEDGPWAAGQRTIYEELKTFENNSFRPTMYGEMMAGFETVKKGASRGLEIADYIADKAIKNLGRGKFLHSRRGKNCAVLADENFLRTWQEDMIAEADHRAQFAQERFRPRISQND